MPKRIITWNDVLEMLRLRRENKHKWSYPALGRKYGTDHSTIMYNMYERKWTEEEIVKAEEAQKFRKTKPSSDEYIDPVEGKIEFENYELVGDNNCQPIVNQPDTSKEKNAINIPAWRYTFEGGCEYVKVKNGEIFRTLKVRDNLMLDLDKDNEIIGIEILKARN